LKLSTKSSPVRDARVRRFIEAVDVYPVTCNTLSNGRSDEEILRAAIAGGAGIIQLRDKDCSRRALLEKAKVFRELTGKSNALLIINDHIDIALAVDADGVHLGQNDFPVPEARKLLPSQIIGLSTHSLEQAMQAQKEGADYINIGPVFPTATKEKAHPPVGCEMVQVIAKSISIPFTVMGGITLDNIDAVLKAGARRIAVVTAITRAQDPSRAVRAFKERIRAAHS